MIPPVVSADALVALQSERRTVVADVRWYLDGRDGLAAYEAAHLPGAVWIDLEGGLSGHHLPATEGRHPLPTPEAFAAAMGAAGVDDHTLVVAYDDAGGITAARLVVMLRMVGHHAAVLDGGLTAWVADGRAVATGAAPQPELAVFTPREWPAERFASAEETAALAADPGAVVIDARPYERFTGDVTIVDPRPGHIPGARSAPWTAVLAPDSRFLPADELRAYYASLGVNGADATTGGPIAYCGSGVSACMNLVAMEHAGLAPARLYVASFSGWSADPLHPVESGDPHG